MKEFLINFTIVLLLQKKARKTRRQLLAEKAVVQQQLINKANALKDPLEALEMFHKYNTKDNCTIKLSCVRAKDAQAECVSWIFDITERNMKDMYEQSSWGWNASEKQAELTEEMAWYLVASSSDKFLGYSHFRFDVDNGDVVLYWYVYNVLYMWKNKTQLYDGNLHLQLWITIGTIGQTPRTRPFYDVRPGVHGKSEPDAEGSPDSFQAQSISDTILLRSRVKNI